MSLDASAELVLHEPDQLFAPVVWSPAGTLLTEYAAITSRIREVAGLMATELGTVLHYFVKGSEDPNRPGAYNQVRALFDLAGGMAAVNADFWKRALDLTDVYSCLPQARRDVWHKQLRELKTPDFSEENLRATLEAFEADRMLFLAERVDGIFRALSGHHVTNEPQGFRTRMIVARVYSQDGYLDHSRSGTIHDLRCVIAKFMGREDPSWNTTDNLLRAARKQTGKWWAIDGGALRIRVYMVGTAHLEVHPEMAWRLNAVLANLYPQAIPAPARQRPTKPAKEWAAIQRPLPSAVLAILGDATRHDRGHSHVQLSVYGVDKHVLAEAGNVLELIGGVSVGGGRFEFDYQPAGALADIVVSGCVPDQKTHQFYPTPDVVARAAVGLAEIEPGHACLEPSAGTGALAVLMPADTQCVELSKLHARVLSAKGLKVENTDFLQFAQTERRFDRIVMNPPFSQGRAAAHVQAAAGLVKSGGRLVAVLPASMRGKSLVDGWAGRWSEVFANEFAGTSVSVAIYSAEAP